MKTMPAGEFKARCLRVMEEVKKYRTPVVITKKGKPVAKLVPPDEPKKNVFGCVRDRFTFVGDVESPVFPRIEEWDMYRLPWAVNFGPEPRKGRPRRPRSRARRAKR
jgi:prevent-host-death family protein